MCQYDKRISSRMWDTSKVACQRSASSLSALYETTATSSPKMLDRAKWYRHAWISLPFSKKTFQFYPKWTSRNLDAVRVLPRCLSREYWSIERLKLSRIPQRPIVIIITTFPIFTLLKVAEIMNLNSNWILNRIFNQMQHKLDRFVELVLFNVGFKYASTLSATSNQYRSETQDDLEISRITSDKEVWMTQCLALIMHRSSMPILAKIDIHIGLVVASVARLTPLPPSFPRWENDFPR